MGEAQSHIWKLPGAGGRTGLWDLAGGVSNTSFTIASAVDFRQDLYPLCSLSIPVRWAVTVLPGEEAKMQATKHSAP